MPALFTALVLVGVRACRRSALRVRACYRSSLVIVRARYRSGLARARVSSNVSSLIVVCVLIDFRAAGKNWAWQGGDVIFT